MTEIVLYHFSKRKNSTKRPIGQGTEVPCLLKTATTFQSPTFILQKSMNDMLQFNYCKWADHYYFIDATTSINAGQTEITCTEDVLATYKNEIGEYTCFIERSDHQDPLLDDPLYLPTEDWQKQDTIVAQPVNVFVNGYAGNYIMRIVGAAGVETYYVTEKQLGLIVSFMYTADNFQELIENATTKFLFDPAKYIIDLKWLPFRSSNFIGIMNDVNLGYWDSGVQALLIGGASSSPVVHFSYNLELTNPLYSNTDFRFYNGNFSRYFVQLPCIGVVPVDITKTNNGQLLADYYFDAYSGISDVWLKSGSTVIGHYQCQMTVPVNIAGANVNIGDALIGGLSTVSSAMTGNALGVSSGVLNTMQTILSPEVTSIGAVGSVGGILNNLDASVICYTRMSTEPNGAGEGYADGNSRKISTCSGYLRCRNASIEISGFTGDQEVVNNYLNSGFYYE
jgi:hypothetical protein|nr:MAG TPA: hypothetical protein [Caudoviricetes sp.]